jgi:2,4-dienoyl-CoA reductase-like NADH-dependent reductase (Old Yellow Enzyme family)
MNDAPRDVPLLFTPIELRGVVARNRIVCSPMCQYVSDDGAPTDWQLVNFGRFAMSGTGIVFGEETAVEPRGRKTHHCAGLYKDSHIAAYRRINDFIKSLGSLPAIQLGHCGRRASAHGPLQDRAPLTEVDARVGLKPWQGLAPSALPEKPGGAVPHAMDLDDIRENLAAWREATQRSLDAGYEICEIHGAHGYLIHQFLSPVSNRRTDGYGGSLEGRMRFALEVVDAVRSVWPADRPLFFRTSAVEGAGGKWGIDDTLALARELKEHGVDLVDCSSGGITGDGPMPAIPRVPGFQAGYAREIRREIGLPTMAVGMITEPSHAEAILREGHADLIALARELMDNPNWPLQAARALGYGDSYDLVHAREAQRLRLRARHRVEYASGSEVEIPFGPEEMVPYSWPQLSVTARKAP